ncbi:jg17791 [Pararge aegeria aegeria]|uniref:Jg17791 protein n=2 Tax=Pararge aegeria TaxID=116150 RepID=A0A8S4RK85_9NEOP|nr:jg17791 [Pararge aegeria aegeria]
MRQRGRLKIVPENHLKICNSVTRVTGERESSPFGQPQGSTTSRERRDVDPSMPPAETLTPAWVDVSDLGWFSQTTV